MGSLLVGGCHVQPLEVERRRLRFLQEWRPLCLLCLRKWRPGRAAVGGPEAAPIGGGDGGGARIGGNHRGKACRRGSADTCEAYAVGGDENEPVAADKPA